MTTSQISVLVAAIVLIDGLVIFGIRAWVASMFDELTRVFPPRPVRADSQRKRFQSIRVNSSNLGGCVEIATDREHIHVLPMGFARLLGAREISLPREAFANAAKSFGGARKAKLGKWTIAVTGAALD